MDFMVARQSLRQQRDAPKEGLGGRSKRLFDLAFGSIILAFTLPILLLAAAALKSAGARPVFAKDARLGFGGRSFTVVEFSTDPEAIGPTGQKRPCRTSVTKIAAFVRESGIHKLPQLVNVLRGEMSLVGPRALRPSDATVYNDRIAAYLTARPGLVQAPKTAKLGERWTAEQLDSDLDYVRNWRFSTDVAALLRTIFTLKEQ